MSRIRFFWRRQMSSVNDGGPAFGHGDPTNGGDPGMTLRDYLAVHADQPGFVEAYQLAGEPDVALPKGWEANQQSRANKWWTGLSLDEKYRFYSTLRYMVADAMLAARQPKKGDGG